ncbi:MAG: sensor domain-containing protein [Halorhabdus sp.]
MAWYNGSLASGPIDERIVIWHTCSCDSHSVSRPSRCFFTLLVLGVVLLPLLVGVPILVGVLGMANYAGLIEARIATVLLDVDVVWEPTDVGALSVTEYARAVVTTPRNYLLVVYFLAQFLVGTVTFVALTTGLVIPLALLVAPLVYWLPGVRYQLLDGDGSMITLGPLTVDSTVDPSGFDMVIIDTPPEALIASVVGVLVLPIALYLFTAVASLLGRLTVVLFDSAGEHR